MAKVWWIADSSGARQGPLSAAEVETLPSAPTLMWKDGQQAWKPASELGLKWHFSDRSGQRRGPLWAESLARMFQKGEVDGMTLVWREGMPAWQAIAGVEELKAKLRSAVDDDGGESKADTGAGGDEAAAAAALEEKKGKKTRKRRRRGRKEKKLAELQEQQARKRAAAAEAAAKGETEEAKTISNAAVYVSGLPADVTAEELIEFFEHRAGVIKTDYATGERRVKLYREEGSEQCKGDALITFARQLSVQQAVLLCDNAQLRAGWRMRVAPASFAHKKGSAGDGEGSGGDGGSTKKRKRTRMGTASVSARAMKVRKMAEERRLSSWDEGGDDDGLKIVVVKHMFVPADFCGDGADPQFGERLYEDVVAECSKHGELDKVTFFERNPDGVVILRFKKPYAAECCLKALHGRYYAGRQLQADWWDGVTDYTVKESEEELAKRVESFGKWLEGEED